MNSILIGIIVFLLIVIAVMVFVFYKTSKAVSEVFKGILDGIMRR